MPAHGLLPRFQKHLTLERDWRWDGTHYARTSEGWLRNLDARRREIRPILEDVYGTASRDRWFQRWRIFFMACAELFGYEKGAQWGVSHYRFKNGGRG
jgi:cyclopropane-fatty-acyl-phospholipid synthase